MPNIQLMNNLRVLRENSGRTQKDLAKILSFSRQAYSNYETGKRTPDLDALMRLSALYGITLDQLINQDLSRADRPDIQLFAEEKVPYYHMALNTDNRHTIYLTDEEIDIVLGFRSLSADNQRILKSFLKAHSPKRSSKSTELSAD